MNARGSSHRKTPRARQASLQVAAAVMEAMEGRVLMDATAPYTIDGTSGSDLITLSYNPAPLVAAAYSSTSGASGSGTSGTTGVTATGARTATLGTLAGTTTATTTTTSTFTSGTIAKASLIGVNTTIYSSDRLDITVNGVSWTATVPGSQRIIVEGLDGNDTIRVYGTHGVQIFGGNGNDVMAGGSGADSFYGGPGIDTVDYSARNGGVSVSLEGLNNDGSPGEGDNVATDNEIVRGGWGNDTLTDASGFLPVQFYGNYGDDTITGSLADDYLDGGAGSDTIHGNAGNDTIHGGAGNDVIFGDENNDTIFGDDGDDRLYGGIGADALHGGNGDDVLVTLGGGQTDASWGDAGFDNFWTDSESTEIVNADANELARNVHRIAQFMPLVVGGTNYGSPSRELAGQSIVDPTNADGYAHLPGKNAPLFAAGGPSPNEIHQGNLGDCYFLASLSAVANASPDVLRQTIVDLGDGTYAVNFHNADKSNVFIRMDGDLPTNSSGGLAYASIGQPGGGQWSPLLEKAWAYFRKGDGSYYSIAAGWPEQAYRALGLNTTIKASTTYNTPTKMLDAITQELSAGDAVAFATRSDATTLVASHVYMVNGWYTDGTGQRWVVLRNPWGTDGPSGDSVNDGWVTITAENAFASFDQVAGGHV
jgi:Ca2+-binding RTX toxin-like protein